MERPKLSAVDLSLPFEGEISRATEKRFEETIIFIHHYGGNKNALSRHVRLVNDIGFDAIIFNLQYHSIDELPPRALLKTLPITGDLRFGARFLWQEQVETILNRVPGKKIVFAFSLPSNAAILAVAARGAEDIAGFIGDGGPFLDLPTCMWNLYTHRFNLDSRVVRTVFTAASIALFGWGYERDLRTLGERLPEGFQTLSIRSGADKLIPETAIDQFYEELPQIRAERVTIDEASHLEGIRINAMRYREVVERFLRSVSGK